MCVCGIVNRSFICAVYIYEIYDTWYMVYGVRYGIWVLYLNRIETQPNPQTTHGKGRQGR